VVGGSSEDKTYCVGSILIFLYLHCVQLVDCRRHAPSARIMHRVPAGVVCVFLWLMMMLTTTRCIASMHACW
jgi:hypothetical protein